MPIKSWRDMNKRETSQKRKPIWCNVEKGSHLQGKGQEIQSERWKSKNKPLFIISTTRNAIKEQFAPQFIINKRLGTDQFSGKPNTVKYEMKSLTRKPELINFQRTKLIKQRIKRK